MNGLCLFQLISSSKGAIANEQKNGLRPLHSNSDMPTMQRLGIIERVAGNSQPYFALKLSYGCTPSNSPKTSYVYMAYLC